MPVEPKQDAPTPLDRFIAAYPDDDACLALGLAVLEAALREAGRRHLQGHEESITEYVYALRSGKGLNRPL